MAMIIGALFVSRDGIAYVQVHLLFAVETDIA
jgi:hypothetical protein